MRFFGRDLFGKLKKVPATQEDRAFAPHCDSRVLHGPGTCEYCDLYPDRQKARAEMSICFTGETPDDWRGPCPSDYHRGTGGAHTWGGNYPKPVGEESKI